MSMPMQMPALTMSSRDIAELVESRHDKVKQSIERLAERGLITFTPVGEKSTGGRPATVYRVGKRDSYVIVAQLSPEFTARLVDRWQELEERTAKPSLPDFSDPIAAARAWADAKEAEQRALAEAEQARPAVEFVDRFVTAETGSMGFRQVAKLLGANEAEFRHFLTERKVMYRLKDGWVPFSRHQNTGRFVMKAGVARNGHAYERALFTAKGVEWVSRLWSDYQQGVAA